MLDQFFHGLLDRASRHGQRRRQSDGDIDPEIADQAHVTDRRR
jgi:hypothetical protein